MLARLLSRFRSPRPVAHAEFACKECGKLAARLQLFGDATSGGRLRRESFTSVLTDPISAEGFDSFRTLIAGGSARELYAHDLELASFYCPKCDASYCGAHW